MTPFVAFILVPLFAIAALLAFAYRFQPKS